MTATMRGNHRLTARQLQVAVALAGGRTINEAAQDLGCTPRTAKAHADEARRRLGIDHRRLLGRALVEQGYVTAAELFA